MTLTIALCYVAGISQGRHYRKSHFAEARSDIISRLESTGDSADTEAAKRVRQIVTEFRKHEEPQEAKSTLSVLCGLLQSKFNDKKGS